MSINWIVFKEPPVVTGVGTILAFTFGFLPLTNLMIKSTLTDLLTLFGVVLVTIGTFAFLIRKGLFKKT